MKKSKMIFAVIAVAVIAICIISLLMTRGNTPSDKPVGTTPDGTEESISTSDSSTQTGPIYVTSPVVEGELTELDPVELSDTVTMRQVELIAKIERGYVIDSSHEEYIDIPGGDPYTCSNGIIFRNDRTLTIDVLDQMTGVTHSISFGYLGGKCNRFLYLNPICTNDGELDAAYCYQFDSPMGGGTILTLCDNTAGYKAYPSLVIGRTLEEWQNAGYTSPKTPGVVWHASTLPDGPVYIDCRVYEKTGDMIANVRITIERLLDGTAAITNLQDLNLLADNGGNEYFTASEMAYIADLADKTIRDPEKVGMIYEDSKGAFAVEDCLISLLDQNTGLYYNQFIPYRGLDTTKTYADGLIPIVAVSLRTQGLFTQTLYFRQILPPLDGEHGWYEYIGRDYQVYDTVDNMMKYGYSGNG